MKFPSDLLISTILTTVFSAGHLWATELNFPQQDTKKFSVRCQPKIPFQGEVTAVTIEKGSQKAHLVFGSRQSSTRTEYTVVRSDTPVTLRYEYYVGEGFSLTVDTKTSLADLDAEIGTSEVKLQDLQCEFDELDPAPGITLSN